MAYVASVVANAERIMLNVPPMMAAVHERRLLSAICSSFFTAYAVS